MVYKEYPNTIMLLSNEPKAKKNFLQRSFAACKQSTCKDGDCTQCMDNTITINHLTKTSVAGITFSKV